MQPHTKKNSQLWQYEDMTIMHNNEADDNR